MMRMRDAGCAASKGFGPKGNEEAHTVHARASSKIFKRFVATCYAAV